MKTLTKQSTCNLGPSYSLRAGEYYMWEHDPRVTWYQGEVGWWQNFGLDFRFLIGVYDQKWPDSPGECPSQG